VQDVGDETIRRARKEARKSRMAKGSSKRAALPALGAIVLALLLAVVPAYGAVTVPPQFEDELVASVNSPTALAFTPDGRLLITRQYGTLHVYRNGSLLPDPALDLSNRICDNRERGVLGVAVDPAFALNRYIYLYYTYNKADSCQLNDENSGAGPDSPVNRVSRFILGDGDDVDPASETVLIDNIPSPGGYHNAGDLQFGKDGYLYVSTGDGNCDWRGDSGCQGQNDAARDENVLLGKILRITPAGEIPAGNPFQGPNADRCNLAGQTTAGRRCKETYAWGLRNPFRIAFDSNGSETRFFINDVGLDNWEEIDQGEAGADYGWNVREGHCARSSTSNCAAPPAGMTNPIYDYDHSTGCGSVTGGAFVPNGVWPAQYDGVYLYGDYVCGTIFVLAESGGTFSSSVFGTGVNGPVAMTFGPSGEGKALYYLAYGSNEVRRIASAGAPNRAPSASVSADRTAGDLPLTVNFDAGESSDPDGDTLSYEWDFGDGSPHATGVTASHTYTTMNVFVAKVTVSDGNGGEDVATIEIDAGNNAPEVAIDAPLPDEQFRVGETITLTGSGFDAEDGTLPDSSLNWKVVLVHGYHTHPFLAPTKGNDIPMVAPSPEGLAAAANSYLRLQLTATDSRGKTTTVKQDLMPKLVSLSFGAEPTGLKLMVAGSSRSAPATVTSWEGWKFNISAPNQPGAGGTWAFDGWSDGGARTHEITTPASPAGFTASFHLDEPPAVEIVAPSADKLFRVGEQLTLTANATDADDGPLAGGSLTWRAWLRQGGSLLPLIPATNGNAVPLVAPAPESLSATMDSYLEIELSARDSLGQVTTVDRDVQPRLVDVELDTEPSGLTLDLAGGPLRAPIALTSWEGLGLEVNAPDQAAGNDEIWAFDRWSDGGAAHHTITTPGTAATFTASYRRAKAPPRVPDIVGIPNPSVAPKPLPIASLFRIHIGGGGRDRIQGTSGRDKACGRGAGDLIRLAGGDDIGYGGNCGSLGPAVAASRSGVQDGHDRLYGGRGDDALFGNAGNDLLDGGPGRDALYGGSGIDRFVAGPGADRIEALDGRRERIDCGPGSDRVRADRRDLLRGCERVSRR